MARKKVAAAVAAPESVEKAVAPEAVQGSASWLFSVDQIAQVCYEANRALCAVTGSSMPPEWGKASCEAVESAVHGVIEVFNGATEETLHRSWMREMFNRGWVYGPNKDALKRTHPSLMPYAQLPAAERAKDVLFLAIVEALKGI